MVKNGFDWCWWYTENGVGTTAVAATSAASGASLGAAFSREFRFYDFELLESKFTVLLVLIRLGSRALC